MRNSTLAAVGLIAFLLVSVPLFAHHGNSTFESGKKITIKGTVTEWLWANPHCYLQLDVKDDSGNVVHWVVEGANPSDMVNRGWSKQTLKPGDEISITVEPAKNGKPLGRVLEVVLPNGEKLNGNFGIPRS